MATEPAKRAAAKKPRSRTTTVGETSSGGKIIETIERKPSRSSIQALSVPAIYSPTTSMMRGEASIRLAFGESVFGHTTFHAAVVLPDDAARRLAENIIKALDKAEDAKDEDV